MYVFCINKCLVPINLRQGNDSYANIKKSDDIKRNG